jgi:hypothetical protein
VKLDVLKPTLLGAIFTALSGAMAEIDRVQLTGLPRMADFARWGCAVARALGRTDADFLDAYGVNIATQNETAIENSPVALVVIELVEREGEWEGTPTETLARLLMVAETLKIDVREKAWPKSGSTLTKRINEVIPNLRKAGVIASIGGRTNRHRVIALRRGGSGVTAVTRYEGAVTEPENGVTNSTYGVTPEPVGVTSPDLPTPRRDGSDASDGVPAMAGGSGALDSEPDESTWVMEVGR